MPNGLVVNFMLGLNDRSHNKMQVKDKVMADSPSTVMFLCMLFIVHY